MWVLRVHVRGGRGVGDLHSQQAMEMMSVKKIVKVGLSHFKGQSTHEHDTNNQV